MSSAAAIVAAAVDAVADAAASRSPSVLVYQTHYNSNVHSVHMCIEWYGWLRETNKSIREFFNFVSIAYDSRVDGSRVIRFYQFSISLSVFSCVLFVSNKLMGKTECKTDFTKFCFVFGFYRQTCAISKALYTCVGNKFHNPPTL